MVGFDTTFLSILFNPDAKTVTNPATRQPVTHCQERVEFLISKLEAAQEKVLVPTPVLSELLVYAGDEANDYLIKIDSSAVFRIGPFDWRAAVEVAAVTRKDMDSGDKRGGSTEPWQKVKYDRQIVGICLVENCHTIYSDDRDVAFFGKKAGLTVVSVSELEIPPEEKQKKLFTDEQEEEQEITGG